MNQLHFLALSALLITTGASVTSCSSEEVVENNPTFNGKSVKTDFAINIPVAGGKASRQSIEVTQAESTPIFKGMKDIYLASLADATPADASAFTSVFRLPNITAITAANSAKIYNDVEVPVGTKSFIFYGQSAYTGETGDAKFGVLENNLDDNTVMSADKVKFNLKAILPNADAELAANKTTLASSINDVLAVTGWAGFTPVAANADDAKLQKLYQKLTKTGVNYLGSAPAILTILNDLKASLTSLQNLSAGAVAIKTAALAKADAGIAAVTALGNFPEDKGLPQGAIQITSDGTKYNYVENPDVAISAAKIPTSKITYPASLNYTVNTKAKAKGEKVTWDEAVSTWKNQFTGWGDEVLASTRTIALYDNIQYSVARLDVSAKLKDGVVGIEDNAKQLAGAADNQRINGTLFNVTGVIIGGQPSEANWKVLPSAASKEDMNVYDREVLAASAATKISTTETAYFKTLVLDNKAVSGPEKPVYVALELVNGSGADFYGFDGIIKAGAKFYLVAQLDPAKAIADDTDNDQDHVFVQDHVTKVVFTLSDTSLPKAYVGVPDLRSSDLELGLSVDLEWRKGMEFEIEF